MVSETEGPPGSAANSPSFTSRPFMFYFGVAINFLGVALFLAGVASDSWLVFDAQDDVTTQKWTTGVIVIRKKRLRNFGLWSACREDGLCDHLWLVVGGLDKVSVQLTQTMFMAAVMMYLLGLAVEALQLAICVKGHCLLVRYLKDRQVAEIVFPIAAVSGLTAMLLMGNLKRSMIMHAPHTQHVGWGFVCTLTGILLTVVGVVCTMLNQHKVHSSGMGRFLQVAKTWRRRRPLQSRRGQASNVVVITDGLPPDIHTEQIDDVTDHSSSNQ
ncbi:uncharacterized protein LOC106013188 [Aplysia californica]|uniref:Uncharacterized protein LOC106013188 n=1 Tax=Aplysia californica TaxID=6500 RepID=A0ABM1W138_APLCA|nr:uncharacterized protein LOC106013188 [Aplysia californica]